MHLGYHFHIPAFVNSDGIFTPGYQGRFIDSLASFCEEVTCFLHHPRRDELDKMDYCIQSPNVRLIGIGYHDSVLRRILNTKRYISIIRSWQTKLDILLIRGPSPLLPAIASSVEPRVPAVLLLVSDYLSGVNELPQPWWRKEIIRWWIYRNQFAQNRVARKSLTFVNSHKLFIELQSSVPNLVEIRTTTLNKNDFYEREDTCQSCPVHLLYTGRISRSKGLFDIVEAVAILISRNVAVLLDIVGWPEKAEENIVNELEDYARKKGLEGRVKFHGYKAVGPELFSYYRQADIYVIASRSSFEGFPRSIWEAMAHSLPVIATRVGTIPSYIEGTAELVMPNDPPGLADALLRLINSPDLRRKHISRGIELARENTLEKQVGEMVKIISEWIGQR